MDGSGREGIEVMDFAAFMTLLTKQVFVWRMNVNQMRPGCAGRAERAAKRIDDLVLLRAYALIEAMPAENLDKAAAFLQSQLSDAIWDRSGEHIRQRYRDKVKHILLLMGEDGGDV